MKGRDPSSDQRRIASFQARVLPGGGSPRHRQLPGRAQKGPGVVTPVLLVGGRGRWCGLPMPGGTLIQIGGLESAVGHALTQTMPMPRAASSARVPGQAGLRGRIGLKDHDGTPLAHLGALIGVQPCHPDLAPTSRGKAGDPCSGIWRLWRPPSLAGASGILSTESRKPDVESCLYGWP